MKHLQPIFFGRFRSLQRPLKLVGLLAMSWLFFLPSGLAQEFDWVINFGDTSSTRRAGEKNYTPKVISDAVGNIYVIVKFTKTQDFDPGPGVANLTALDDGRHAYAKIDYALAKYDTDGNYIWAKQIVTTSENFYPYIALDSNGYVYLSMSVSGRVSFETPAGRDTLETSNEGRHNNAIFMKYDTAGTFIWAKMLQGITTQSRRQPKVWPVIAVDPGGNVYLAGRYNDSIDFDPGPQRHFLTTSPVSNNPPVGRQSHLFLAKYDTDGNFIWVNDIEHSGNAEAAARLVYDIIVSNTGNVYITGINNRPADFDPGPDTALVTPDLYNNLSFLAKYDSDGNYLWSKSGAGGIMSGGGGGPVLAEDDFGNIYTTGTFGGTQDFDPGANSALLTSIGWRDMYISKYDSNGRYIWAKNMGGAVDDVQAFAIALSKAGNIYIAGAINGLGMDIDPCPSDEVRLTTSGRGINPFLAQFDASGNYQWAGTANASTSLGSGSASSLAINPEGDIYTAGTFWHILDFDPSINGTALASVHSPIDNDWYVWKLRFNDTAALPVVTIQECDSFTLDEVIYTSSGRYSQYIPSVDGCSDSTITFDLVIGNIEKPIITVGGFVLGVHKPYNTYQWIKDGVPLPGATGSELLVTENGDYQVVVTGGQDCLDTSAIYRVDNTMVDNLLGWSDSIKVYPNPVDDVAYIQSPLPINILLTDIAGRKVCELPNVQQVNMRGLSAGIYVMQIKSSDGVQLKNVKVVKK